MSDPKARPNEQITTDLDAPQLGDPVNEHGQRVMMHEGAGAVAGFSDGEGGIITEGYINDPSTWVRHGVRTLPDGGTVHWDEAPMPQPSVTGIGSEVLRKCRERGFLQPFKRDYPYSEREEGRQRVSREWMAIARDLKAENERLQAQVSEEMSANISLCMQRDKLKRYRLAFRIALAVILALSVWIAWPVLAPLAGS